MRANSPFERPARGLVLAVAGLLAFVLAVTVIGHYAFGQSVEQNSLDTETLVRAGRLTISGEQAKDDAQELALASNPSTVRAARTRLRADISELQDSYAQIATDADWRAPRSFSAAYTRLFAATSKVAQAPSPREARPLIDDLVLANNGFQAEMQGATQRFGQNLNRRSSRRLWVFGAMLPGACGFVIAALAAILLPRALRRIRAVNDTLIQLEAASASQAAELEQRNNELQSQQDSLRSSEAELIMKTEQLEATSLGSQQAARRFEELFQGLPVACIGFSDDGRVFEWNRASTEMFGYDAYQVLHMKLWKHIAEPGFGRRGASIVRQVFQGKEYRNTEWTYSRPDGRRLSVLGHLFPLRGLDGRILGGVAACLDVTDRLRAEEEVRSSEKLFRDLIDSLHEGVLLYDETGRIVVANKQAGALLGLAPSSMIGRRIEHMRNDFVGPEKNSLESPRLPYQICLATGQPVEDACVGLRGKPGRSSEYHWFSVSAIPLYRPDDKHPYGVLSSFSEITDRLQHEDQLKSHVKALASAHQELKQRQTLLEQANSQLESLAVTDGLTGLYNHRAFQERLEEEVKRSKESLSLLILDVDHFKRYNDTFGHPEGDGVLRRVAALLKSTVGRAGITARYGGEEFAIILPGYAAEAAQEFGENLCKAVAQAPWPNRAVTISAGVATLSPSCTEPATLIREADEALYKSKHAGRNRSTHASASRDAA